MALKGATRSCVVESAVGKPWWLVLRMRTVKERTIIMNGAKRRALLGTSVP